MSFASCRESGRNAKPIAGSELSASDKGAVVEKLSTIEFGRRRAGIARATLAAQAGASERYLRELNHNPSRASSAFVARLEIAFRELQNRPQLRASNPHVLIHYGGFLTAIAPFYGVTPTQVRATDPRRGATADRHWQRCAHARQAALYLTNTALGLPQRQLAAALGLTPAAVCLACRDVEERRSDPAFEAAIVQAQLNVTGAA